MARWKEFCRKSVGVYFESDLVPALAPNSPSHARGVMGHPRPALPVKDDQPAVPTQSALQILNRINCSFVRRLATRDAIRRPLCQDQFHHRLAPTRCRNGRAFIVGIATAPDQ